MKKKLSFCIVSIILLISFLSCSQKTKDSVMLESMTMDASVNYAMNDFVGASTSTLRSAKAVTNTAAEGSNSYEKKLIKRGSISLEVENLTTTEEKILQWVTFFDGTITWSQTTKTSYSATLQIPTAKFQEAMDSVGSFGKIVNRSVSTEDVSERYYDLSGRLETKKTLQAKLQKYLSEAKNIQDLLNIEKQLNEVTSDIESMEGQMRRLSNQIDYSTIDFYANLPYMTTDEGLEKPPFVENLSKLGTNILYFLSDISIGLLYLIIFGIPIILILALIYWLSFGKIGLVRKLFIKLSPYKTTKLEQANTDKKK